MYHLPQLGCCWCLGTVNPTWSLSFMEQLSRKRLNQVSLWCNNSNSNKTATATATKQQQQHLIWKHPSSLTEQLPYLLLPKCYTNWSLLVLLLFLPDIRVPWLLLALALFLTFKGNLIEDPLYLQNMFIIAPWKPLLSGCVSSGNLLQMNLKRQLLLMIGNNN